MVSITTHVCVIQDTQDIYQCQEDNDECIGVLYHNGGLCLDKINGFDCHCNPGFEGALCEIDSNDCINISCSGRGSCIDGVNSFTCSCESSYTPWPTV